MAYDNVCKFLIESFPTSYLSWLLEQPITESPQILKTELPVEPVRADFVSFWQVGGRIVHVEFQTQPQENVPLRMLNYFARLRTLYGLDVLQVVIYLQETGSEGVSVTEFCSENTFHRYQVIRMWEQDPGVFLQDPELLPLAVLAQAESPESLLQQVVREVDQVEDRRRQSDLAACAEVLGGLRFSKQLLRGLFREEIVKESVIYQDILQEGREKGREEGREQGREQGREEGKEEGKQLSQQEWVESLLLSKFGEIDPALARIIPSLMILSTSELAPLLLSADREQLLQRFGSES